MPARAARRANMSMERLFEKEERELKANVLSRDRPSTNNFSVLI
jgi:hypothetical protein